MGRNSEIKMLRGQMRQVVKELWKDIVTEAYFTDLRAQAKEELHRGLKLIQDLAQRIDDRNKDVQTLVIKEIAKAQAANNTPPLNTPQAPTDSTAT